MPALTSLLYRRPGPRSFCFPAAFLFPPFPPRPRPHPLILEPQLPGLCPPPPSSELSSLESLNDDELSSLESDGRVRRRRRRRRLRPARRPPFSPSAHSPPEAALRSIPSSSNCASYPVSPCSQPAIRIPPPPPVRANAVPARLARTSPARSRSATARSSSTTHRSHLHRKPHTLASRAAHLQRQPHQRSPARNGDLLTWSNRTKRVQRHHIVRHGHGRVRTTRVVAHAHVREETRDVPRGRRRLLPGSRLTVAADRVPFAPAGTVETSPGFTARTKAFAATRASARFHWSSFTPLSAIGEGSRLGRCAACAASAAERCAYARLRR